MNCRRGNVDTYQNQLQLISLWIFGSEISLLTDFEILSAAARVGADLKKMYFILPDIHETEQLSVEQQQQIFTPFCSVRPQQAWINFIHQYSKTTNSVVRQSNNGRLIISVHDVVRCVVGKAQHRLTYDLYVFYTMVAAACLMSIIPLVTRDLSGQDVSGWNICFFVSSTFVNFFFFLLIVHFIIASITDALRRVEVSQILSTMARPSGMLLLPVLSVRHPTSSVGKSLSIIRSMEISSSFSSTVHSKDRGASSPPARDHTIENNNQNTSKAKSSNRVAVADEVEPLSDAVHPFTHHIATVGDSDLETSGPVTPQSSSLESAPPVTCSLASDELYLSDIPKVDLNIHQNVSSWLYARTVLMCYGHRMLFRVNIYVGTRVLLPR